MIRSDSNLTRYLGGHRCLDEKRSPNKAGNPNQAQVDEMISGYIRDTLGVAKQSSVKNEPQEGGEEPADTGLNNNSDDNLGHTEIESSDITIENCNPDGDRERKDIDTGIGQQYKNTETISGGIIVEGVNLLELSEDELDQIVHEKYNKLSGIDKPDFKPFAFAYLSYLRIRATTNYIKNSKYLTVVDFTKSSGSNRFYVINLETNSVEDCIPVGHGHGKDFEVGSETNSSSFSNEDGSNKSSLGSFVTSDDLQSRTDGRWEGLLMTGVEESNYRAKSRGIYIHPGPVTRSEGCFTLWKGAVKKDEDVTNNEINENKILTKSILEKLKGGSFVFSYFDSLDYLYDSWVLNPTIENIVHDKGIIILHKLKTTLKNLASKAKKMVKKQSK